MIGIDDARRAVDDVERRMEALLRGLARGDLHRILVGHPAGVDAVHVDAVGLVVGGRRARHHVERRLRHVRVRMPRRLEVAVELPLHRRHVDDVLVALRRAQHQRLEARVEDERRDRVDQLHLEQLDRRHLGQQQPPRVALAQIDLLQILIEPPFGKELPAAPPAPPAAAAPATAAAACVRPATLRQPRRPAPRRPSPARPPAACGTPRSPS